MKGKRQEAALVESLKQRRQLVAQIDEGRLKPRPVGSNDVSNADLIADRRPLPSGGATKKMGA